MNPIAITPTDKKGSVAFKVVESGGIPVNIDGAGGGDISGVTLKAPDTAMVTMEFVQELGAWYCSLPQDLTEGADVAVVVNDGVVSITIS